MVLKKVIFGTVLVLFALFSFGQIKENKVLGEYLKLDRDSLINTALNILNEEDPIDLTGYRIKVMANSSNIYVSFISPFVYCPLNCELYYGAHIDLIEKYSMKKVTANPADYNSEETKFYKLTYSNSKHLDFVLNAINNCDEIGHIDHINEFKDVMIIHDKNDYYEVSVFSDNTDSWYKVEKVSGRIYDAGHAHSAAKPEEDIEVDPYREIKK